MARQGMVVNEKRKGMGEDEEAMDLADEVHMAGQVQYSTVGSVSRFAGPTGELIPLVYSIFTVF